jgi:hypothetical protein
MTNRYQFLLSFWLVVITDPYAGLNYDKLNVYESQSNLKKITIEVYCAEGHEDCKHEDSPPKEEEYEEDIYTPERVFCYLCNPPQWIEY